MNNTPSRPPNIPISVICMSDGSRPQRKSAGKVKITPLATELDADPIVATQRTQTGSHQVPDSGQTSECERLAAHRHTQAGDFHQRPGDECGKRVRTEAESGGRPGCDRHDIFDRPRHFGTDNIGVGVHAKGRCHKDWL